MTDGTVPLRPKPSARDLFVTYVWSRKVFIAVALASNSILGTIGALAISAAVDQRIERLTVRRNTLAQEMTSLEQLANTFEGYELLRTSFEAALKSTNAEDSLKYGIDQLYRENAHGTLRRITAVLYPAEWKDRSADYDKLLSSRYDSLDAVQKLTAMENELVLAARARITDDQRNLYVLADRVERLSRWRNAAQIVLNGLTGALFLIAFLYKTEREK